MTSNDAFFVIFVVKMSRLWSLRQPRRRVERGRACRRWTSNSLLRVVRSFSAESPAALDRGIDVRVAVHCLWRFGHFRPSNSAFVVVECRNFFRISSSAARREGSRLAPLDEEFFAAWREAIFGRVPCRTRPRDRHLCRGA